MNERQQEILKAIIQEYIATAEPVSSAWLAKRAPFALSSATMRIEMAELSLKGFLEQPHTSAGRIPTEKAYRFFVDELRNSWLLSRRMHEALRRDLEPLQDIHDFHVRLASSAGILARYTGTFGLAGSGDPFLVHEAGLRAILGQPEFRHSVEMEEVLRMLEVFRDYAAELLESTEGEGGIKVFIGAEHPFRARNIATILGVWGSEDRPRGFIAAIGPMRMPYMQVIPVIRRMVELLGVN